MAKKKITTKKKESTIERNKARNAMMLNDAELSDVSVELCYNLFHASPDRAREQRV